MTKLTALGIESLTGYVMLEFGATWCEYCQNSQSYISMALSQFPNIQHIKIEDGKGQRLGRLYLVKLWPTLIILNDGKEIGRVVRPVNLNEITKILK